MSDWAQLEQDLLPLDLAALLDKVNGFVHRYVVVGTAEGIAITLWVAHCWVLNAFDATGYLEVRSPVRRCGKTTLLDVLDLLTPRSRKAIEPSEAVLFRRISGENGPPTLLLDETDAIFNRKSESTEGLRACLNAGNRRGTKVPRCVPPRMDVAEFEVFCAKALAGIGGLPATITDRSIPVEMRRKQPGDRVERFRTRKAREQAAPIAAALERWGAGSIAELEVELIKVEGLADDGQPLATLDDRAWENAWEPLLAVASLAGDEWRAHAIAAAVELSGSRDDQLDEGINLLADIRRVFDVHLDRVSLSTQELLDELLTLEESPWRDAWSDPRSDDIKPSRAAPRKLAQTLRPFGIHPADVWMPSGVSRKGYRLDDFRDGWDRYLAEHEPSTDARDGLGARDPGAHADSHLADEERESARPADEPRDARGESAISSRSHAPRAHRPTGEGEWLARDGVWHSIPDGAAGVPRRGPRSTSTRPRPGPAVMSGYLVEATNEIRRQAEAAEGLADDLENPAFYPRTELRDLLAREFQQDLSNGRALWLETVMDDIAVLVTRHYAATARELADELGELVYDSSEDEEEERQRLLCLDCGENTIEIGEFYMVKEDVWAQVCEPDGGMLCIGCLEERLGRRLVPDDFKDCQLHHQGHLSERLRSRLRGAEEAPAA